ncbi:hypothetical protein E2562_009573 [Oryza meyeriana var. granulata]|uniref:Uncharacterized protein n=1 Tax=Oryza meyeriana var. granulata TaxID=110450 RepID=A0A6G1F623_9ORYZ|nr:hypothetical protein E2562_009573 [Oryza meyeriana var. granulata]
MALVWAGGERVARPVDCHGPGRDPPASVGDKTTGSASPPICSSVFLSPFPFLFSQGEAEARSGQRRLVGRRGVDWLGWSSNR